MPITFPSPFLSPFKAGPVSAWAARAVSDLVVNGDFSDGLNGWTVGDQQPDTLGAGFAKVERNAGSTINSTISQSSDVSGSIELVFDILEGAGSLLINESETIAATPARTVTLNLSVADGGYLFRARCYVSSYAHLTNISARIV